MKTTCLYFQIHQPFRLRTFPFFDIGTNKNYFDEKLNNKIVKEEVSQYYLPFNRLLLKLIHEFGKKINVSFCISGTALEQFEKYSPEVIASFKELLDTGCVEIIGETYAHSFAALISRGEFNYQINAHKGKIYELFGVIPRAFRITKYAYTDAVADILYESGFDKVILEGIDKVWKNGSVNTVYKSTIFPDLKLLVKNQQISDDFKLRFTDSRWAKFPLSAEKYVDWIMKLPKEEQLINIFMDFGNLGKLHQNGWDVFEFMDKFIRLSLATGIKLSKPSLLSQINTEACLPVSSISFSSGKNSQQEVMCCLGNEIQQEAFYALYYLEAKILATSDADLERDWRYLQSSDHFSYMCTKHLMAEGNSSLFSPYESPYKAYINFMNVLSDLRLRSKNLVGRKPEHGDPKQKEIFRERIYTSGAYQKSAFHGHRV